MRTARIRKTIYSGLALLMLAGLWLFFAPGSIGGSTSYVVTDGVSMEPRFHSGDLALVRSQDSYRVGQIVAYHSRALHTVVLHRIVALAGSRYVFKGDNNNFLDIEHPGRGQLIGALWMHLPGWGARLKSLRSPGLIAALIMAGTLLLGGAAFARRRRRRGRERRTGGPRAVLGAQHAAASPRLLAILACGVLALLPFVGLALMAYTTPTSSRQPAKLPYRQSGRLSYSAAATPGPAYPGGRAVTGQPLFTHMIGKVELRYGYRFAAGAAHSLAGRGRLLADITSTSGWQTQLPLGRATLFRGDHATIVGTLDLPALLGLLRRLETSTAVAGTYSMSLLAQVNVGGSLGEIPLRTTFSQSVKFDLNRLEVRPVMAAGGAPGPQQVQSLFASSGAGAASGRSWQPSRLSAPFRALAVDDARGISAGAILLVVLCTCAALLTLRPRRREEGEEIRSRYGPLIVPVARVWLQPGVPVIDVEDMEALARIAGHYERSILHEDTEDCEAFWVTDESGQFRYAVTHEEPAWAQAQASGAWAAAGQDAAWQEPSEIDWQDPAEAPTATHRLGAEQLAGRHLPAY